MAAGRRRVSNGSDEEQEQSGPISPASSNEGRPVRQTSIRLARKTKETPSTSGSGRKSARTRRPTPVARSRVGRRQAPGAGLSDEEDEEQVLESYSDDEVTQDQQGNAEQRAHTKSSTRQRRNLDGTTTITRSRQVSRRALAHTSGGNQVELAGLSWYERLLPSFMLNITAPLTGYEQEVPDSDVEEEEYAILDRSRIKRNRRIRRRLVTVMLLAAAASLFIYTRGRLLKKVGVRAAVSSMKQRIEDGLSKTVQETMGK